ncbi:MAG TPA: hypothetical protein VG676_04140, partial [Chitinophagaceae bacterium]|nr:hypothetical protein [Chitinophagaceae bacterium]
MKKKILISFSFILLFASVYCQSPDILKIRDYRSDHEKKIINEFVSLLSIPNVASDSENIQKNTAFIMEMMKERGIREVQLLFSKSSGAPPAIYGEVKVPGAKQTLV